MNRRRFIYLSLLAIVGTIATLPFLGSFSNIVKKILLRDLQSIEIPREVLDKFLNDAAHAKLWNQFSFSKQLLIRIHFYVSPIMKLPYYHKYLHYKNIIAEEFLMSTTYFTSAGKFTYIGLFNPYKRPCYNPFSTIYNPQSS